VKVMVDAFTDLLSSRLAMRGKMITGANHTYIHVMYYVLYTVWECVHSNYFGCFQAHRQIGL